MAAQLGELGQVSLPNGDTWTYQYDAFGRRVRKTGPTGSVQFVWDADKLLHESRCKNGKEQEWVHWGFYPDNFSPVAKVEKGVHYLCVNDPLGSPRELLTMDSTVSWAGTFTTFGELARTWAAEVDCPVRFPGQWCDEETGLHYNRFRYYNRQHAVLSLRTPWGIFGGVRHCHAPNPVGWMDPLGLVPICGDLPPEPRSSRVTCPITSSMSSTVSSGSGSTGGS